MTRITRTEQVIKEVTVGTVCDACGKQVDGADADGWIHFHSGHTAWGPDSGDSYETHDACSIACLAVIAKARLEHWGDVKSLALSMYDIKGSSLRQLAALADE